MGCSSCATKDPSADFIDKALAMKNTRLRKEPLQAVTKIRPIIDRTSVNAPNPGAAEYKGGSLTVSGALADTIGGSAASVADGSATDVRAEVFAKSLGVLYHESFHVVFSALADKDKPSWYKKDFERYKGARNKDNNVPFGKPDVDRVLEEALGEYVQGSVSAYAITYAKIAQLKAQGKGTPGALAALRSQYEGAFAANRLKPHGYWQVDESHGNPELGNRNVRNTNVKLSGAMLAYADSHTGLTGKFHTDFAQQLKVNGK